MRNYCSLWDINYCPKGLALYESLVKHSSERFTLHVLAMDSETVKILNEMALPNVHVIPLATFERALNLEGVREGRTWPEYCWTCASSLMEYLLPWCDDGITYVDSDVYFFSDAKVIFDEIGDRSVGITPHRFSEKEQERLGKNGDFNVGIVVARNTEAGRACIARWASQCRERCSASEGCGDQIYLNEFPALYGAECCVIQNLGVNLGPWSLDHLRIVESNEYIFVLDGSDTCFKLNSFHFHEFIDHKFLTGYPLQQIHMDAIYMPYVAATMDAKDQIRIVEEKFKERTLEGERQWETA